MKKGVRRAKSLLVPEASAPWTTQRLCELSDCLVAAVTVCDGCDASVFGGEARQCGLLDCKKGTDLAASRRNDTDDALPDGAHGTA